MRDAEIIGLMNDYNRFKKYYKTHFEESIKEHFLLQMRFAALADVLFYIPGFKWLMHRRLSKITHGFEKVK